MLSGRSVELEELPGVRGAARVLAIEQQGVVIPRNDGDIVDSEHSLDALARRIVRSNTTSEFAKTTVSPPVLAELAYAAIWR